MKKYDGKIAIWVMLGIMIIASVVAYDKAYPTTYAYSQEGLEGNITFYHTQSCDSAKFYFGFDGDGTGDASGNLYEVVTLLPVNSDSTTLTAYTLDLDSIGMHLVEIYYWEKAQDSTSLIGTWLHLSGITTPTDTTESGYAVSSQGFGPDTLVLYFNDTSASPVVAIGDVFFSIQDGAGEPIYSSASWTASGKREIHLTDGSYTVVPRKTGYVFPSYALTASGNDDSVEVAGYNISLTNPGSASLCNVFGYILDGNDAPIADAMITGVRLGDAVAIDTSAANSKIITQTPIPVWSDTTGLFQLHLRKTTEYADTTNGFYLVTCVFGGEELFRVERLYVPDAATFDIGDTILSRSQ